jgi:2,3-bisphosphoglycerate-dependent phosphoglycerate mutase
MEKVLYLIRHAQSNPRSTVHHSKWPLSRRGLVQAQALMDILQPLGIRRLFSSPFLRCLQTVTPFAERVGLSVEKVEDLRERLVTRTLADDFEEVWQRSWEDFDYALPGCESSTEARERFARAVEDIAGNGGQGPLGLSTHGNVIGLFLNWTDEDNGRCECEGLMNPDIIRIVYRNGTAAWDRDFRAAGLAEIATHPDETPFEREEMT